MMRQQPLQERRKDEEWKTSAGGVNHSLCWRWFREPDNYSFCRGLFGCGVKGCLQHQCVAEKKSSRIQEQVNLAWVSIHVEHPAPNSYFKR